MSAAVWREPPDRSERPGPCAECARLREQGRAAVLSGDRPRLGDVRVMQAGHRADAHGQRVGAAAD
jgi:hypothetical protein